jgi:predicted nucleotidyltransferase
MLLERAVAHLGALSDEMVFVGGCATGLLLTDPAAPPIRTTQDVDVLTEVATRSEYYRLSEKLRAKGFSEDQTPNAPICRWVCDGVMLDIMPTNPDILGFGNEWYEKALQYSVKIALPSGVSIHVVTSPYFLATKLAAFEGRGNNDYVMSHDIEDIVAVLDGRSEIIYEVKRADGKLRRHLSTMFSQLLADDNFTAALSGHLPTDGANQARLPLVIERIEAISQIN